MKKVYAHGAINPVVTQGEWVYFPSTVAGGDPYPVCFNKEHLPELIKYLQSLVKPKKKETKSQYTFEKRGETVVGIDSGGGISALSGRELWLLRKLEKAQCLKVSKP